MIEPSRRRGLGLSHAAGIAAIAVVGGIVAFLLFWAIAGFLFHVLEIVVIVALIVLLIRWVVGRALR